MRRTFRLLVVLGLVSAPTQAATILESGYGFQYSLFAATGGGGANQINVDDGAATTVMDSETGLDPFYTGMNTAEVVGSLAMGKIGAKSFDTDNNGPGQGASARVRLYETLTFDLTGYDAAFTDDVEFAFGVDGSYVTDGSGLANGANVRGAIHVDNVADPIHPNLADGLLLTFLYASDGNSLDGDPIRGLTFTAAAPDGYSFPQTAGDWTTLDTDFFAGAVTLFGGRINTMTISYELFIGGTADFLSTGTILLESPYAYTSASGVFLSGNPPATIPLPASALLMLGGFGLVGLLRRRNSPS